MSEPYDSPMKRCRWCGEDVLEEDYDKETCSCRYCLSIGN